MEWALGFTDDHLRYSHCFPGGMMVGRTPEYLGKKIESWEMKMVTCGDFTSSACILVGAGLSAVLPGGLSRLSHKGPHGLSEIVYAFTLGSGK